MQNEIKFNKIIAKIPSDLHVYIQDKVFDAYDKELKDYEVWKRKMLLEDKVQVPDINVDNQVPIDDIFQEGQSSHEW